jgi:biotin synthase
MTFDQLSAFYYQPLFDLISQSRAVHLEHWRGAEVQRCSLLSIKTGGCSEDCAYCAQSAHYSTGVEREELLSLENILAAAKRARSQGATRFCMGAAWRGVHDGSEKFERVLGIVREVSRPLDMKFASRWAIGPGGSAQTQSCPELLLTIHNTRHFAQILSRNCEHAHIFRIG